VRELVAFVYSDPFRAAEVMATLDRLRPEHSATLNDAVCITRDPLGNVKLRYALCPVRSTSDVRFWRELIEVLVSDQPAGAPAAPGAPGKAGPELVRARPSGYGIDGSFSAALRARLTPGTSAVFVLVRDVTSDRLVPHLSAFGGDILRTPLAAGVGPPPPGYRAEASERGGAPPPP
jgi:uncharacterized membrane protein